MPDAAELRIRLLGGLAVEGLDERRVGSRQGRRVLKLLALARGAPVAADRIADALWGSDLPARPIEQVGVLVSRLRSVLGRDRVPRNDAGYALRYDWLDLVELELRVLEAERRAANGGAAAARSAAEAALALVRGPLLPDEDGIWVDAERVMTTGIVQRARRILAESALDAGDHGTAVAAADAALADDPYDEVAVWILMRAHVAAGRPGAALIVYEQLRHRLNDELGASPSERTRSIHAEILAAPGVRAPTSEPRRRRLINRIDELGELIAALSRASAGDPSIVVLEGDAGMGKTTLLGAVMDEATDRGFQVVACQVDGAGRSLPLQPVLDGLALSLRAAGADVAAAALGPDEPILGPFLDWQRPTDTSAVTMLQDAEAGRALLFAGTLRVFERLASGGPILIVLDGIDLADEGTIEWLTFATTRYERIAVLAARRPGAHLRLERARVIALGPLDRAAAAELVGSEHADHHYSRSGGNPLFLLELSRSDDMIPSTVREAVVSRAVSLGDDVAHAVRTAALVGPEVDLDLLAGVLDRPIADILDCADAATAARILVERGSTYAFDHDLVREALAADLTAARRAHIHRSAARVLSARTRADWRRIAWHAKLGADREMAAAALHHAAIEAGRRHDHVEAARLLDEAIALNDGPRLRLARARARLARWEIAEAQDDVENAIGQGAGADAFELAGWVAYYGRDYDAARRFADEGAATATDAAMRASCLALGGRTRHASGSTAEAEPQLAESAMCELPEIRNVASTWLSLLRAHQGRVDEARELAERALVDPERFAHPFARFHAWMARCLALGMAGRVHETLVAADGFETEAARAGDEGARFVPVAMNMRAWGLRAVGSFAEAEDVLRAGLELSAPDVPSLAEPRFVAALDLAETLITSGDLASAGAELDRFAPAIRAWEGTMSWRARQRLALLDARRRLCEGDAAEAGRAGRVVAADARLSANARHAVLAACLVAEATAVPGEREATGARVDDVLVELDRCAGFEGWFETAKLATAYGMDRWRMDAERRAERLIATAGPHADQARRHVRDTFERLGWKR